MIGIQKAIINSIPHGGKKKIADALRINKIFVSQVLHGEVNPDTPMGRKIVEMAGSMAAREIFEFSWELKKRK
jgi:hypothetical protein